MLLEKIINYIRSIFCRWVPSSGEGTREYLFQVGWLEETLFSGGLPYFRWGVRVFGSYQTIGEPTGNPQGNYRQPPRRRPVFTNNSSEGSSVLWRLTPLEQPPAVFILVGGPPQLICHMHTNVHRTANERTPPPPLKRSPPHLPIFRVRVATMTHFCTFGTVSPVLIIGFGWFF